MENINKFSGKVLESETGVGIAGITVILYDHDPNTKSEEETRVRAVSSSQKSIFQGDRIGSVATNEEGYFELEYSDSSFKIRNTEKRPDIMLEFAAPYMPGDNKLKNVLGRTHIISNAGVKEFLIVKFTKKELENAGISIGQPPSIGKPVNPPTFEKRLRNRLEKRVEKKDTIKSVYSEYVEKRQLEVNEREKKFIQPFTKNISRIPNQLRGTNSFVENNDSVHDKTKKNIESGLELIYNSNEKRPKLTGVVRLTEEQLSQFHNQPNANGIIDITEEETAIFEKLISGNEEEMGTTLIYNSPADQLCREQLGIKSECTAILFDKDGNDEEPEKEELTETDDTQSTDSLSDDDINSYLAKQMANSASPEQPVIFGTNGTVLKSIPRADVENIENNISDLKLKPGPADSPAFRDVHQVQIAFPYVWQEWMDGQVIDLAEQLYDKIVEMGGYPDPESVGKKGNKSNLSFFIESITKIPENVVTVFNPALKLWKKITDYFRLEIEYYSEEVILIMEAINLFQQTFDFANADENDLIGNVTDFDNLRDIIRQHPKGYVSTQISDTDNVGRKLKRNVVEKKIMSLKEERSQYLKNGQNILAQFQPMIDQQEFNDNIPSVNDMNVHEILQELEKKLNEPYSFKYYAANKTERSINFGIILTYRQKLTPCKKGAYQAGELVKTIPLAPKETRKYTKKEVNKKNRSVKEVESSLRILKEDSSDTSRAESEILAKAGKTSNYTINTEGNFNVGIYGGNLKTSTSGANSQESSNTKKNLRESVLKAAQEYKQEHKLEINTEESFETEFTESGEISNPNDEITVTYLFYELQQCFRISEHLHRLQPVIFVAQEMPDKIDNRWVLTYDWIISRALMDDTHRKALNDIRQVVGKEFELEQLRENIKIQRKIVTRLEEQLVALKKEVSTRYRAFEAAVDKKAGLAGEENISFGLAEELDPTGIVDSVSDFLFGDDDGIDVEEARIRQEAATSAYEKAARDSDEMLSRIEREVSTLNAITAGYTKKLTEYLNIKTDNKRLLVHIKENILHYMQAIWSHEPDDQRFFRLCETPVVDLAGTLRYHLHSVPNPEPDPMYGVENQNRYNYTVDPDLVIRSRTLKEVADLDNMLGFKGNYMIFPVKTDAVNSLHSFMMTPYIDRLIGLRDPDPSGNWNLDDFAKYICCLKEKLGDDFEAHVEGLKKMYEHILTMDQRQEEMAIVPTGSLFIEALPGKHPILEDFKLVHRAVDVKKVQAEVREMELDNIRQAARILENNLEDPDTERIVVDSQAVQPNLDVGDNS